MEKIEVNGENTHPVYAFLRNNSELYDEKHDKANEIPWNFAKFVVNHEGKVIKYYHPQTKAEEVLSFMEDYIEKH